MLPLTVSKVKGFTLIESLVIVLVVGILATIAAPSFLGWLGRLKVEAAASQLQSALQVTQQEAMRRGKICTLNVPAGNQLSGDCLVTGEVTFADGVAMRSNLPALAGNAVKFGFRGNTTSAGTIVIFASDGSTPVVHCVVTSVGIGMVRSGIYTGDIDAPSSRQCRLPD